MGGSISGNKSKSSGSTSTTSDIWGPQGGALGNLYNQAGNLYQNQLGNFDQLGGIAPEISDYMGQIAQGAQGAQQNLLGGGSIGDTSEIRNQLLDSLRSSAGGSQLGNMYQSIVGGEGNTYIDPIVDRMNQSSMENLDRMQSGTGLDAAKFGQGGSSRHAMQNAMQARAMNSDMLDRETALRTGAYDKDLQMKMDIAKQADAGIAGSQDRLMSLLGQADKNVGTGLSNSAGLQNLGMGQMAPYMQASSTPFDVATQYANIIGRPTVLQQGKGAQSGSSKGVGQSASLKG